MMTRDEKLLITIVRKEKAKKVVQAAKSAGAEGGTTLLGRGIKHHEKNYFLGIPVEREREIILTAAPANIMRRVVENIIRAVKLTDPKQGIAFILDLKKIAGISHVSKQSSEKKETRKGDVGKMAEELDLLYDLIVTIVNKGDGDDVVEASRQAGAEGGTIIHGRGTGIHEQAKLFNILIEPEKEIVLSLITRDKTNQVLEGIEQSTSLDEAGKGIAFVLEVEHTIGINHILNRMVNERMRNKIDKPGK